jgi:tetratricopeptide (TPR) repeat protein
MPTSFIIELKKQVSEGDWARILRSLRNEPLVWQALQNEKLAQQSLKSLGAQVEKWSPASIALLALGYPELLNKLTLKLEISIEEKLLNLAALTVETYFSNEFMARGFTITETGLMALALRERYRLLKQWDEITSSFHPARIQFWRPVIACLFGMLPDPHDLLIHLFSCEEIPSLFDLGIHTILSNPLPVNEQCDILTNMILPLSSQNRLDQLRKIFHSHPPLGQMIAKQLIELGENTFEVNESEFDKIQHLLEKSEILKISGQYNLAMPKLEEAMQTSMRLQVDLAAQIAQAAAKDDDKETALYAIEQVTQIGSHLTDPQPEVTLAKIQTSQLDPSALKDTRSNETSIEPVGPATLLAKAKLSLQEGDRQKAQLFAQQALEVSLHLANSCKSDSISAFHSENISAEYLQALSETLLELDLPIEGCRAAELSLEFSPNDPHTIWLVSHSLKEIGEITKAMEFAHIAVALSPENQKYRRNLIEILMAGEAWEESKEEVEKLITTTTQENPEDYYILAQCNLNLDLPKQAASACQRMLHVNPNNGKAHALLGETYQRIGDIHSAIEHFNQAIAHEPELPLPWLELADYYLDKGEVSKAKERLLAAIQVMPENPEIQISLGQIYLQENDKENAIEAFKLAEDIARKNNDLKLIQKTTLQMGEALCQFGLFEEACQSLQKAHKIFPTNPEISHTYGKALLASGNVDASISILSQAIQSQEIDSEIFLDYGMAHLALGRFPEEAIKAIKTALKTDPNNPKGLALLAEATAQCGNHKQAIIIYQKAIETEIINDLLWYERLSIGMAKSAIALKEPEIAIATLEEALTRIPENLGILKVICQAYIQAKLTQDGLNLLLKIFNRDDSNFETLIWVADQAITLKEIDIAIDALNKASELKPKRAEVLIRLGYIQLENDEPDNARKTFGQLFDSEKVKTNDLKLAAQALINLGDIESSIPYLEKALELSNYQSTDLLSELATIYEKAGDYQKALETLQKHIGLAPDEIQPRVKMSGILLELGRNQLAIDCILDTLELEPDNDNLHMQAAILYRREGNLSASLDHIEFALELSPKNPRIQYLAVEANNASLNETRAREILDSHTNLSRQETNWYFLKAENALASEDWMFAEKEIQRIKEPPNHHPRYKAIQARILQLKGESQAASETFIETLELLGDYDFEALESFEIVNLKTAIAQAAQALGYWDVAKYLAQQIIIDSTPDARDFLNLVMVLVRRAEYQHNCQAVEALHNVPGHTALNKYARETFDINIQNALKLALCEEAKETIRHWHLRGSYALHNKLPGEVSLRKKTPEDRAAEIAAFRRAGEFDGIPINENGFDNHPIVLFQLSLGKAKDNPQEAIKDISKAIERQPNNPFFLALKGYLTKRTGDIEASIASINQALSLRAEEPRWHALAAELQSELGQHSAAIAHLEQASKIEPNHAPHFYQLGKAYIAINTPGNSIRALEQAIGLDSSNSDHWIALCKAHRIANDLDQAAKCADHLIKLNPNQVEPILLRASIALDTKENNKALALVNQAKRLNLENPSELKMLSRIMLELGKTEEAISLLDNAIGYSIEPLPLLLERANAIAAINGHDAKLDTLKALAQEYPEEPSILAAIVSALIEINENEGAIKMAQQALKMEPKKLDAKEQSKLYYQLGTLLRQEGQLDQAIHHLQLALDIAPNFLEAHLELGEVHYQRREYQQALEYFTQAIKIAPYNPIPFHKAGVIQKECKDYIAAEAMLRQAVQLAPKDLNIQRQLGAVIALTLIHKPKEKEEDK